MTRSDADSRAGTAGPLAALLVLLFALCLPLLLTTRIGPYTWDQEQYHLPAVRQIAAGWPRLDLLRDSLSATAPGYHYLLATVAQATGTSGQTLRGLNFLVAAGFIGLLCAAFPRGHRWLAVAVAAPLAFSNFYVKSACWLVTDNAALFATGVALLLLVRQQSGGAPLWLGALAAAASTSVRQMNVWLAGPLAVRAYLDTRSASLGTRLMGGASVLLPAGVLAYLVWRWGGLVPPIWSEVHRGDGRLTTASLTYILAVLGSFAPFYLLSFPDRDGPPLVDQKAVLAFAGGVCWALTAPTTFDPEGNRWGGYWWHATQFFPAPGGRSLLLTAMAGGGAWLLLTLVRRLHVAAGGRLTACWSSAFGCWMLSSCANLRLFQRYFEPPVLLFLILWALLWVRARPHGPVRLAPLAALAVLQIALTIATAHVKTLS